MLQRIECVGQLTDRSAHDTCMAHFYLHSSQDFCSRKPLFSRKILILNKRKETPLRKRIQSPVQFLCEKALLTVDIFSRDSFIPSVSIRPVWYFYKVHYTNACIPHTKYPLRDINCTDMSIILYTCATMQDCTY